MFLILVKIFLLIPFVNGAQLCYSSCNQVIPFNTALQPPSDCTAHSNASLVCAVSVTFASNQDDHISIFYFTPSVSQSRPSFVDTEASLSTGILSVHIFHECPDCNIFENTRNIIASMQSIPNVASGVISKMRQLFPINNSTTEKIECHKGDDEKETIGNCQSCSLDTNRTDSIRSCKNNINLVGVQLYEHTTLDDQRELGKVYVECVQSRCNTRNTAQEALRIFAYTGLAQHYYDLSSSATILSYSFTLIFFFMLVITNVFDCEFD
ncbi:unnamed protein product [Rotaria sp. Silwood1]|nr:unnamed protein product [Rotaria sp. Silwood1]CAF1616985.1 unnamed protein product [Rotaria sp. Silwood1]CAF3701110.1 unnamed protein product [Rotaria sp. Silwood1]CAF3741238.1 unnamed protein product [Rotaria sp. Silwood1]CAF4898439.1 unnamed protein product [Rotaria sp. Silwood1]